MEVVPDFGAVVLPMVKHPFVVGFLVAELPKADMGMFASTLTDEQQLQFRSSKDGSYGLPPSSDKKTWEIQVFKEDLMKAYSQLASEKRSRAIMISRSLAMAYVMDQVTSKHSFVICHIHNNICNYNHQLNQNAFSFLIGYFSEPIFIFHLC